MNHKFLHFILLLMLSIQVAYSQGLIILDPDGNDITGDTLRVHGDSNASEIYAYIQIQNDSEELMQILARKIEIDTLPGTMNSFCWNGSCFPPSVYEAETPMLLEPGETSATSEFYGEYLPNGKEGESIIEYEFFSRNDGFETVKTTVIYITEDTETFTQSPENIKWSISSPFPNPAHDIVRFNHSFPHDVREASILIQSITGAILKQTAIDQAANSTKIDVSSLNPGFYLYSLQLNGSVAATGKIIIR